MSGTAEKYSFYDMALFLANDLFRKEFGSTWEGPWDSSFWESWKPGAPPSFGASADPKFDIEFGPIVETYTDDFSPYVAHHQSIKLIAKSSAYKLLDCIDCGFHDDVRTALTLEDTYNALDSTPSTILSLFPNWASYSSMGDISFDFDLLGMEASARLNFPSACWHDVSTPLNEEDVHLAFLNEESVDGYMDGSVNYEYGDYVEYLEQVLLDLDEKDIPNFYLLMSMLEGTDLSSIYSPLFHQAVDYLLGNVCADLSNDIKSASTGFRDFLVSSETVPTLPAFKAYDEYFSLRAETEFSTTQAYAGIADKIKDVNLDCRLLRWMAEKGSEPDRMETGAVFEKLSEPTPLSMVGVESNSAINVRVYDLFKFCGTYGEDLASLSAVESLPSSMAVIGDDTSSALAATSGLTNTEAEKAAALSITIGHFELTNLLRQALSEHNKTYQQVFFGEKPHSETIAYKISKYKKDTFSTTDQLEIVQSVMESDEPGGLSHVWIANSSDFDIVEYIDTQMKYDEGYVIIVWAYNLVLGTRYFYSNYRTSESDPSSLASVYTADSLPAVAGEYLGGTTVLSDAGWTIGDISYPKESEDLNPSPEFYTDWTTSNSLTLDVDDDCEVAFTATTMPMAVIKEVPYFVWPGSIVDNPPAPPDVKLVPYSKNDSELLILLNSALAPTVLEPIIINEDEQSIVDEIRESQNLYTGEIEYGNDNPIDNYEIFRMTDMPSSYSDFSGNFLTNVSTMFEQSTGKKATAASFVDNIEPNTRYYYTFRAIDIHGHFSNPSHVFEVELVTEASAIIPYIRVIYMEDPIIQDASKAFKSILHVVPRVTQAVVNEEASGLTGDTATVCTESSKPVLGVENESLWGKEFKIRLTSRRTKRKFDINVAFGTEFVESEPDTCAENSSKTNGDEPTSIDVETSTSTSAVDGASTGDPYTVYI